LNPFRDGHLCANADVETNAAAASTVAASVARIRFM
jgi:hypothetical protein